MRKNHYLIAMALCAGTLAASTTGCELIASVDRSLIKGDGGGAGSNNTGGGGGGNTGGGGGNAATCANGTLDGDETAIDCGGSCPTDCKQGDACTAGTDCESTFCANSVCCDTACDGSACLSCTKELKVSGEDGTCGPTRTDGPCGAAQACAVDPVTGAAAVTLQDTCSATQECKDSGSMACDGFACDAEGAACVTACAATSDCTTCFTCNTTSTKCEAAAAGTTGEGCTGALACDGAGACKKANGETCAADADCANAHCADGVCCDVACSGNCQACNVTAALTGTCSPVERGAVEPLCTAPINICNDAGACKLGGGAACTLATECASGACTFNVCGNP